MICLKGGKIICTNGYKKMVLIGAKKNLRLSAGDFPVGKGTKITFQDESYAFFHYSFYIVDENLREFAVFTEHCWYHVFNLGEILIETFNFKGEILTTYDNRTE